MKCPKCGSEKHPEGAIYCLQCGGVIRPEKLATPEPVRYPHLSNICCWLEGKKRRKGLFGPARQGFGISLSINLEPKKEAAVDGTLRIRIRNNYRNVNLEKEVPVRKEEFRHRRFDLMTVSFDSLSWIHRHPEPEIFVPVDGGGYEVHLQLTANDATIFEGSRNTFFSDREPGTGEPPTRPWT